MQNQTMLLLNAPPYMEAPIECWTEQPQKRALVVEDDVSLRPFWENVFQAALPEIKLDWAVSEAEAETMIRIQYRAGQPYEMVVADICLEGEGTGFDLWNRYGEAVRHFVFTSSRKLTPLEYRRALKFGAPLFLPKPLSTKECQSTLKALCAEDEDVAC